jgi:hypothetical protein
MAEETVVTPVTPVNTTDIKPQTAESTQTPTKAQEASQETKPAVEGSEDESTLLGKAGKPEGGKAPEKYDFKVPEGMSIDTGLVDKITPIFKEMGITQENAQKLVNAYAPYVQEQMKVQQDGLVKQHKEMVTGWMNESKKELGANADTELAYAAKFINKFGSPALRDILDDTGVGNHPEVVKAFIKAGKMISEDVFVDPQKKNTSRSMTPDEFYATTGHK